MTAQLFEKVLEEVKQQTDFIYLHVMGEPLLHPQLKEILSISKENQIFVHLTTNGVLIKKQERTLLESGILRQINFSLHSTSGNQAECFSNEYFRDIFLFCQKASEEGIYCVLRLWNDGAADNRPIWKEISEFFQLEQEVLAQKTMGNGKKLAKNIFFQQQQPFQWPDIHSSYLTGSKKCYALKDHIGILSDATVVPCCLDSEGTIALGNLKSAPLSEILISPRAKRIQEGFQEGKCVEKLCQSCGFFSR